MCSLVVHYSYQAEGAATSQYKDFKEEDVESIKGLTAASENYGNFFGQNLFIGAPGVMLIVGSLNELGYTVDAKQGPITIAPNNVTDCDYCLSTWYYSI